MPLTQISLRRGKSREFIQQLMDHVYLSMRDTFIVPEDDRFMTIRQHDEEEFLYGKSYLGIKRSDDLIIIQITANNTRTLEQKKALYLMITQRLHEHLGARPEDILINLVEVAKENWSLGNGVAQYA